MIEYTKNKLIKFDRDLYTEKEIKVLNIMSSILEISKGLNQQTKEKIFEVGKDRIKDNLTPTGEKAIYKKMSKDTYFYIYEDNYKSYLFEIFASDEIKADKKYLEFILKQNPLYLKHMPNYIKDDKQTLIKLLRKKDLVEEIKLASILKSVNEEIKCDPEVGLAYIKNLKRIANKLNKENFVEDVYYSIFDKDENGLIIDNSNLSMGNKIVSSWLESREFVIGLINTDKDFIPYIERGKIKYRTLNERYPLDWIDMSMEARKICNNENYKTLSQLQKSLPLRGGEIVKQELREIIRFYSFTEKPIVKTKRKEQ